MMEYSVDHVYRTLQLLCGMAIGSKLSTFKGVGNTRVPSIFKTRAHLQNGATLTGLCPFVTITAGGRNRQGAQVNHRYRDTIDDEQVLVTIYEVIASFNVFGGPAEQLAGEIESFLNTDASINFLLDKNMVISDTYGVRPDTTVLDNQSRDFASLQVRITTTGHLKQEVHYVTEIEADVNTVLDINDPEDIISSSTITIP